MYLMVKYIKDEHVTRNENVTMAAVEGPVEKMTDRELTPGRGKHSRQRGKHDA